MRDWHTQKTLEAEACGVAPASSEPREVRRISRAKGMVVEFPLRTYSTPVGTGVNTDF